MQLLHDEGKYGPITCYAFTVNYILGVGCLGVPYAFLKCGVVLGTILTIVLSFVSYITVMWVAEAAEQELQLRNYLASNNPFLISPVVNRKNASSSNNIDETKGLISKPQTIYHALSKVMSKGTLNETALYNTLPTSTTTSVISRSKSRSGNNRGEDTIRELEVTDLADEFLGSSGKFMYQTSLVLLTFVGLMAYAQVFNSSFLLQVWPSSPPHLPALFFAVIVVPLSCFDLAEQVTVQIVMSILRFLSLGILAFGTLLAIFVDSDRSGVNTSVSIVMSNSTGSDHLPYIRWQGFGLMFTTAIFSHLFQHSVPGLIRPLSTSHKKKIPTVFKYALATTSFIYIVSGWACVYYFGNELNQSVNLNFVGYTWGIEKPDTGSTMQHQFLYALAEFMAMIVVIFPALDTLSVFPLIANTLGNNLNSAFPGLCGLIKSMNITAEKQQHKKISLILWRLIAAIPPIVFSIFLQQLSLSLEVAGLCGIIVALVTPALLKIQSPSRLSLIPLSLQASTPFTIKYGSIYYTSLVLLLAVVAMIISIFQMTM